MINEAWVHDRLDSPLFASLAQVVELAIPATGADAGAGRIFEEDTSPPPATPTSKPLTYVSAGRLGIPRQYEPIIHDWPTEQRSIFEQLREQRPPTMPFRPSDVLPAPAPADQLFGPIEARCRVVDALAVPVNLDNGVWSLLMLFRCGCNPPFQVEQEQCIQRMHDHLATALTRGYQLEHDAQPATSPPLKRAGQLTREAGRSPIDNLPGGPALINLPDASLAADTTAESAEALRARLSVTERRVLEYLLNRYTERRIGEELERSPHTIHVHVKNIYRKLNISSRKELLQLFDGHVEPISR